MTGMSAWPIPGKLNIWELEPLVGDRQLSQEADPAALKDDRAVFNSTPINQISVSSLFATVLASSVLQLCIGLPRGLAHKNEGRPARIYREPHGRDGDDETRERRNVLPNERSDDETWGHWG